MMLLQVLSLIVGLTFIYAACRIVYNLFFHPLAKFPGPKIASVSNAWYCKQQIGGRSVFLFEDLHLKYGDVVRIAPNELSISTIAAAKDIYGHASKGTSSFLKSDFYDVKGEISSILRERDPQKHREIRKNLSHGFSTQALRMQLDVVIKYVDMFVKQIERLGHGVDGIPMDEWYNWVTFDIIGDLTFGEPFGAVAEAKTHFWIRLVTKVPFAASIPDLIRRCPALVLAIPWLLPDREKIAGQRKQHRAFTREKVKIRMGKDNTRDDFFSQLLSKKLGQSGEDFLLSNGSVLIIAGSETTASALAAATYYLLRYPKCLQRLKREVRTAFKTTSEIDDEAAQKLSYLKAVVEEALRIYTPLPIGLPRVSPGAEVDGYFIPKGTIIHSPLWFLSHSPKYWHHPHGFHPERWLPKDDIDYDPEFANDNKDAFKPFSQGPRVCIGVNLAYMELRIIIAKLVWHFDWELVNRDLDWNKDSLVYMLWKKPALRVRFTPCLH